MLYLAGKGDGMVKYFEMTGEAPWLFQLDEYRNNDPQKGIAWLPKRACDTTCCEVMRAYRLLNTMVEIDSFQVPRKADAFQKDIFPDAFAGIPSLTADEWFSGQNRGPLLKSMKPGDNSTSGGTSSASSQVSSGASSSGEDVASLKKTIAEQAAKIKQLEEQLAKLKH